MIESFKLKSMLVGSLTAFALASSSVYAKPEKDNKSQPKTVAEITKDKTEYEGFLDFYQDPKTGSTYLVLNEEQLNKPILYFTHTVNGVLDAGHFKGAFREYKLLEFNRHFDKLEITSTTPRYLLDEDSPISRSEGTNISPAVLASLKIEAQDNDKGQIAVKVDKVFLAEVLHKVSPTPRPPQPGQTPQPRFKVGSLSKSKTKYTELKSFPKNSDVVVEYVFDNKAPVVRGSAAVSDPRSVVVKMQHSFIELPENGYHPRRDDPRIGYFHQQFDDLSSDKWVAFQDVINRWDLKKKDPSAEISEPVEPIVWWIENTTPLEWRDTIKEAAESWNIAFEKAGFKNALVVKIQPDDAEWEADDIRYNVLRWTASPRPPFGGYGPSVANPLTGQILASDIMLEYSFMKNLWMLDALYTSGASMAEMEQLPVDGLFCSAGHRLHQSTMFGQAALNLKNGSTEEHSKLLKQSLSYLILHELGHTLGLNHNMKASQLHNATDIHDASITQGVVAGSVMDYPAVNIAPLGVEQGDYYNVKPGPYDIWAIEYGYSPALEDAAEEEQRLTAILNRSSEPELMFGNDAEDMRAPGRHIDPRIMISDLSNEAVKYSIQRIELVNETFKSLKDKAIKEGESYHQLTVMANILMGEWRNQATVMTRYVGGIEVDRSFAGQDGATQPFTPVALEEQKAAVDALNKHLFAPDILAEAEPLFAYLQPQRRGFNGYGKNEDPKLHAMVLSAQKRSLAHLLHQNVLMRLSDSALYGNQYSLHQFMTDLTDGIFASDLKSEVNGYRQNLQNEYVQQLIAISGANKQSSYDYQSQASALSQLKRIHKMIKYNKGSGATRAHRDYLEMKIQRAFEQA